MIAAVAITIRHSEVISEKIVSLKYWSVSAGALEILKDRNEICSKMTCGYLDRSVDTVNSTVLTLSCTT